MSLEHQIIILERFLNDHVTLKYGAMMLKMPLQKTENSYFNLQMGFGVCNPTTPTID